MSTLVIKTNASQGSSVLIRDMGFLVPASGGSVTITSFTALFNARGSTDLLSLATDNAFGAGDSTLILNDGNVDISQSQVSIFIDQIAGIGGETGFMGTTGLEGLLGTSGFTGLHILGLAGNQGLQGQLGLEGRTGVHGFTGVVGTTGFGSIGANGLQSPIGLTGLTPDINTFRGSTGYVGQSINGSTGLYGVTGLFGITGSSLSSSGVTGIRGGTGIAFISDSIATDTVSTNTTSGTDSLVSNMTLTPAAGTYICWFTGSVTNGSNNTTMSMNIYAGGVIQQASEVMVTRGNATNNLGSPFTCLARVTVNGSQAIEGQWRTSGGTATMTERTLYIQKI